jgi:predicted hydrolase (HD superfamily)
MITVMQGILNVKLKSRAKAENVVRISEENLRKPKPPDSPVKKGIAMNETEFTRANAWTLLHQYTQSQSLLKHALAVEACMGACAEQRITAEKLTAEVAETMRATYCITGLLHDFDYEKYPSPEEHPFVGNRILAEQGWPEEIREAIMGHANYSGVARTSHLAKALFACDELAGFLTAVSLVKPTRSIFDVDPPSVRKKMKDKGFARGVHREDIIGGAQELGVDLDQHIALCIAALRGRASELGLDGAAAPAPKS